MEKQGVVPRVEQRAGTTPGWVDSWKSGELVIILRYLDNDCLTWKWKYLFEGVL